MQNDNHPSQHIKKANPNLHEMYNITTHPKKKKHLKVTIFSHFFLFILLLFLI